jgi:hypothetical protein
MEWKTVRFKVGDIRERLKFAWLPIPCEDGVTRWLCKVRVLEKYVETGYDYFSGPSPEWRIVKAYRAEVESSHKRKAARDSSVCAFLLLLCSVALRAEPAVVIRGSDPDGSFLQIVAPLHLFAAQGQFDTGQLFSSVYDSGNTALKVNCVVGCGAAASFADNAAFTAGTTAINITGGWFTNVVTNCTNGSACAPQLTNDRKLFVEDFQGTSPWVVSGTVTTTPPANASTNIVQWAGSNLGAMANYGTSPGAVLVPGVNAFITNTVGVSGTVTTTPPANASTNLTQVAGTALGATAVTNFGTAPAAAAVPGVNASLFSGTTGLTNTASALDVNLKTSSITLPVSGTFFQATQPVSCTSGATCPVNATLQAGSTTAVTQTTSPWIASLVSPSGLATGIGPNPLTVSDSPFPTWGASTSGASPNRAELTECQFNAPLTKLTIGQSLPVQCDPYGNIKVTVVSQPAPLPTVTTPVVVGTLTDRSGTVTTGGTSQQLAAANPGRKYLLIENPTTATEALYVNFTAAASTAGSSSISISPGGSLTMSAATYVSQEAVTVTATTTGHGFTAKEQ